MTIHNVNIEKSVLVSFAHPDVHYEMGPSLSDSSFYALFKLGSFPESVKYKRVTQLQFLAYNSFRGTGISVSSELYVGRIDEETATYNSIEYWKKTVPGTLVPNVSSDTGIGYKAVSTKLHNFLEYAFDPNGYVRIQPLGAGFDSTYGTNPPYFRLICDDYDIGAVVNGFPNSGYVPKNKDSTFKWEFKKEPDVFERYQQSSAVFRWRESSSSITHETQLFDQVSLTIPAGTFTTDTFEWQVTATTTTGQTATSPWYSITTVDSVPSSVAVYPNNTIVDATKASAFLWEHVIDTGTEQTAADLQISNDGSVWNNLANVTGAASQYEVPASTLPSGNLYWRVRTYNTDSVPGDWSDPLSFLSIGAPPVPTVSSEQTPRPLVSWQSDGQQSAEISVGDWTMQFFGNRKSIKLPFYLSNGSINIRLRTQNKYGIWSDFGSYTLNVVNVPSGAISLTVNASYEARLSWEDTGGSEEYLVYRNGVPIARTDGFSYVDVLSIGSAEYFVRGIMSDSDNYTDSNAVTVSIESAITRICSISGGDWIDLPHTEIQLDTQATNLQRNGTLRHFLGADYPLLELSQFRSKTVSLSVATMDRSVAQRLEELSGDVVCLKTSRGEMVIGAMLELNKYASAFYSNYSIKLQQIHYNEEVEL